MTYGVFAQVYDTLMDAALFSKWQAYTKKHLPNRAASILELGCGNGELGLLLKKQGYDITGLDLSAEMLALAERKQKKAALKFPLVHGDMRDLSQFSQYDAVISFCDTLCYLETQADLALVFSEVGAHLKNGGVFLFDVFTTEYIEALDGYAYHDEVPGIVFIWDSFSGEEAHSIEHDLSFFVEQEDGLYKRHEELHKERTYPLETYLAMLKEAGFTKIEVTADFDKEVTGDNERWFFKAQKPGNKVKG